jgi:hypothetical protein
MIKLLSFLGGAVALEKAQAEVAELRRHVQALEHTLLNKHVRVELQQQALTKAEADATYWRQRAERFIDQVALRERIIATPTMTEPEPAPTSPMDSVFSALGQSEIRTKPQPPAAGISVLGVDADAAHAAVEDVLARVGA